MIRLTEQWLKIKITDKVS